ncbi:hypothetical protein CEXT_524081 [Caerostris extrusa]|uniref:Uncharacterized protein n=1 Tax=Caerostris extrusa TaxID=172846 RepID=A0AAV4WS88_CAEEX|nr:hypothetical protein CEXT_524081 [Caerostris extrusa]
MQRLRKLAVVPTPDLRREFTVFDERISNDFKQSTKRFNFTPSVPKAKTKRDPIPLAEIENFSTTKFLPCRATNPPCNRNQKNPNMNARAFFYHLFFAASDVSLATVGAPNRVRSASRRLLVYVNSRNLLALNSFPHQGICGQNALL